MRRKKRAAEDANIRKINTGIMGTLNIDAPLELTMYDNDGHYAYAQGTLKIRKKHSINLWTKKKTSRPAF